MKRGEIYLVDLGPGVGREPAGVRPVVVVSSDVVNLVPYLVTVVPAVNASDATAVLGVPIPAGSSSLPGAIAVLAGQPRALDASRFPEHPAGVVPAQLMDQISFTLKVQLDLP